MLLNDQNLQKILLLCDEHSSVLRAVFLSGSRAYGGSREASDYDLLFVYHTGTEYGEIKLLSKRLALLPFLVEPFFISSEEFNSSLHFSHLLFVPFMTAADHGQQIWGESLKIEWHPDRTAINACRVWSLYLVIKAIEQKLWPLEVVNEKYLPLLLWATLSLDEKIPESELGSGHKVKKYFSSLWPQAQSTPMNFSAVMKVIAPRIRTYLNLNKVEPVLFKSLSVPTLAELTGHTDEGQLADFNSKFLKILENYQNSGH